MGDNGNVNKGNSEDIVKASMSTLSAEKATDGDKIYITFEMVFTYSTGVSKRMFITSIPSGTVVRPIFPGKFFIPGR
jgi:hypothetical protein